jgi:hypothetical protein
MMLACYGSGEVQLVSGGSLGFALQCMPAVLDGWDVCIYLVFLQLSQIATATLLQRIGGGSWDEPKAWFMGMSEPLI